MNYTEEQITEAYEMQDWDILMEHFEFEENYRRRLSELKAHGPEG